MTISCSNKTITYTSFTSGLYYDLQIVDSYIFFSTGRGIEVFSFKHNQPKKISRYPTDGVARAFDICGQYAYVADDYNGLCVLDISNLKVPQQIGNYRTNGQAKDVVVEGNYAYLADYNKGFIVLDISNPSSPYLLGSCNNIDCASWIKIKDTLAYVGVLGSPFEIINIADPSNPYIIGSFPQGSFNYASDIYFDDTLAYVNCRILKEDTIITFAVINIDNPICPKFIAGISLPSTGQGIVKKDDLVYINTYSEGVYIIDVGDPYNLKVIGQYKDSKYVGNNLILDNELLIVPHLADGFSIADVKDPQKPKKIFHFQNMRWEYLVIDDSLGYLYLLGNTEDKDFVRRCSLEILDIKNPKNLIHRGGLSLFGRASLSDGSYRYPYLVLTKRRGHPICDTMSTDIIDISNPNRPQLIKSVDGGGIIEFNYPNIYALDGRTLKVGNIHHSSIWTRDINLSCKSNDFVVKDTLAYIITDDSLLVVNIGSGFKVGSSFHNTPLAANISLNYPLLVSTFPVREWNHTYGFLLFDVKNQEHPSLLLDTIIYGDTTSHCVRSLFTPIYAMSCKLQDTLFFIGRGIYGFDVWKIDYPTTVSKIYTYDTPFIATHCYPTGNGNIRIYKDQIFIIDFIGSLEVFMIQDMLNDKKKDGLQAFNN